MAGYLVETPEALAAIPPASRTEGMLRFLSGVGWYEFQGASVASAQSPWVIAPDAGSGRWRLTALPTPGLAVPPQDLSDASTVTINASLGGAALLQMEQTRATRQIAAPSGLFNGQQFEIWIRNPGSPLTGGGWPTFTLAPIWKPRGGVIVTATGANKMTLLQGRYLASFAEIYCEVGAW
jgi:hypothetical protein